MLGRRESHAHGSRAMAGRLVVSEDIIRHIFTARGARRDCIIVWWWGEVNERARARGHARLRTYDHGRVVCAHSFLLSEAEGGGGP